MSTALLTGKARARLVVHAIYHLSRAVPSIALRRNATPVKRICMDVRMLQTINKFSPVTPRCFMRVWYILWFTYYHAVRKRLFTEPTGGNAARPVKQFHSRVLHTRQRVVYVVQ